MKSEIEKVKDLGEKIGYGHLMSLASALWRKELSKSGSSTGAFVPTLIHNVKSSHKRVIVNECNNYDKLIEKI